MSRILVIGASGLVGSHLVAAARALEHDVCAADREALDAQTATMDLNDRASVAAMLARVEPDVVAVCSAWPWVDGCEQDPERSERDNVGTVRTLLDLIGKRGTKVVFYSTDHVFDGARASYVESDPVAPMSVYARHKRVVEELLLTRGASLIVRTAWVFGAERRRKNFVYRVVDAARSDTTLRVPRGQAGCPTWAGWLAATTLDLIDARVEGIVHATGDDLTTKAEWARIIASSLGLGEIDLAELSPSEAGQCAPRPARVTLRSERHTFVHPSLAATLTALRPQLVHPI